MVNPFLAGGVAVKVVYYEKVEQGKVTRMVKSIMVAVVVGYRKPSRPQSVLVKPFLSTFHRKHLMYMS